MLRPRGRLRADGALHYLFVGLSACIFDFRIGPRYAVTSAVGLVEFGSRIALLSETEERWPHGPTPATPGERLVHRTSSPPRWSFPPPLTRRGRELLHAVLMISRRGRRLAPRHTRRAVAVDFEPDRRYGLTCFVVDSDGKTHAEKGMVAEFRTR